MTETPGSPVVTSLTARQLRASFAVLATAARHALSATLGSLPLYWLLPVREPPAEQMPLAPCLPV
jgi:hypothetical protein